MSDLWQVYFPDDCEDASDARFIYSKPWDKIYDAEDAARKASELDYGERDGWTRGMDNRFAMVIVAPDGTESRWEGWHEASVDHWAERAEGDE